MPINSFLYPGAKVTPAYEVANSLRFEDGSSDTLSRTPSSSGNRKTWTFSAWIKRSELGRIQNFFSAGTNNQNYTRIQFNSDDTIYIAHVDSASTTTEKSTTQKFRDVSSWMHVVWHIDTTQSTASNREKFYINGVQVTDFSTNTIPAEDYQSTMNEDVAHYIGTQLGSYEKCSCYFAEVVFIDGQALTPTSFGEFDSDSPNIWKPINVSGLTFGTNGFYLEFKQSGTSQNSSGLGADTSGNDHHFAVSNLTATDQSTDTCTNNFAVLNRLAWTTGTGLTFSEGNLKVANSVSDWRPVISTIPVTTGKWYCEIKCTAIGSGAQYGVTPITDYNDPGNLAFNIGDQARTFVYINDGNKENNGSAASYGDTYTTNDIIGIAIDLTNNYIYFSKNGTFQASGDPTSGSSGTNAAYALTDGYYYGFTFATNAGTGEINFGSPPYAISSGNTDGNGYGNFEYSVPSGYYSLCTKNLAEFG